MVADVGETSLSDKVLDIIYVCIYAKPIGK